MPRMISRLAGAGMVAAALLFTTGCAAGVAQAQAAPTVAPAVADEGRTQALLAYLRSQNTTGFLVIEDGRTLIDQAWSPPVGDRMFSAFLYGHTADGVLLEDVASQQKSFIAVLTAVAVDKGLLDVDQPVSRYLGAGWSKATPEQEGRITVLHLLNMTSGLDEGFAYTHPAGDQFFYNTPVYAVTKRVLTAASGESLDAMTRAWLTEPLGMKDTNWRRRPAALASVGNDTALVTTPRDIARLGLMVLSGGLAQDETRVVSQAQLAAMFERSQANPSYGRLWWLNGADYAVRGVDRRTEGPLIAAAPMDLVGAYGLFERRLYIVPSHNLVVVRTGAAAIDKDFDQQLWLRLTKVLGDRPASAPEP